MGANASRVQRTPDFDPGVVLRNGSDAAETTTTIETPISLRELRTAYWHTFEIPYGTIVIDVEVLALNLSTNTYTVDLIVDDVVTMNDSPVQIASIPITSIPITSVGIYAILLDAAKIMSMDPDHSGPGKFLAARVTMGAHQALRRSAMQRASRSTCDAPVARHPRQALRCGHGRRGGARVSACGHRRLSGHGDGTPDFNGKGPV